MGRAATALIAGAPDAFLHASLVTQSGHQTLEQGATLVCDIAIGPRGPQVAAIHSVGLESAMLLPVTNGMRRRYAKIRAPTVIVAGSEDRYLSTRSHSERLHSELRYSTFMEVPGAGHMVHHAAPGMILEAIALASR
jgi:pimeloyl-ACP methyl ester carboxylesterase